MDAFVEGVRSIGQACHLVILLPVAAMIVAARGRWATVIGGVVGIALGGWIFAAGWVTLGDRQIQVSGAILMLFLGVLYISGRHAGATSPAESVLASRWTVGLIAALGGAMVTMWWRPCVGEELGDILTLAPSEPWQQLPSTVAFMLGISLPLIMIGSAFAAWRPRASVANPVAVGAVGVGLVLAVSVAVGQHGEVVGTLFEWSQ